MLRANGVNDFWEYDGVQRPYSHGLYYPSPYGASDAIWVYGSNASGQLTSIYRTNDAYAWGGHVAVQRPYTTNGLNQYTQTGGGAHPTTFTYDDNGSLATQATWDTGTSAYVTSIWVYDIENRLVGAPSNVTLTYDPLGRLYRVQGVSTDRRFLYDGDALVAEYDAAGAVTQRYAHNVGADVPMLAYEGSGTGNVSYLHADHQGSIVSRSSSTGAATINSYDEYGIPATGNTGRFQYTGQIWLPELGMYYYKARVYSPTLGRFMQVDPIGYEDQRNLYAYVRNDPVNSTDPRGLKTKTDCQNVAATCVETVMAGVTFGGNGSPEANMKAAQLALAPINAALTASTGHEYGNVFETNSDGSVTSSVSVSDDSPTKVTNALNEIRGLTDNPSGDQHVHPGLPPGVSYVGGALSNPDVDSADAISSMQNRSFNRSIVDGPTGNIISFDGRPNTMTQNPDGSWQRRPEAPTSGTARIIGRIQPIRYHAP